MTRIVGFGVPSEYIGCSVTASRQGQEPITAYAGETQAFKISGTTEVTFTATMGQGWRFESFNRPGDYVLSYDNPFVVSISSSSSSAYSLFLRAAVLETYTIEIKKGNWDKFRYRLYENGQWGNYSSFYTSDLTLYIDGGVKLDVDWYTSGQTTHCWLMTTSSGYPGSGEDSVRITDDATYYPAIGKQYKVDIKLGNGTSKDWKMVHIGAPINSDVLFDVFYNVDAGTRLDVDWYDRSTIAESTKHEYNIVVNNSTYPGGGTNTVTIDEENMNLYPANPLTYSIVVSKSGSGTVSGNTTVDYGASTTLTFTPSSGYAISDVSIDQQSIGAVSSYTFSNVTSNHLLQVSFVKLYNVTVFKNDYAKFYWAGGTDYTRYDTASHTYSVPSGTSFNIDWIVPEPSEEYQSGYLVKLIEYSSSNPTHMATSYGGTDLGDRVSILGNSSYYCAAILSSNTTYYLRIIYDANGGSGAPSGVVTTSGTTQTIQYTVSSTIPTKSGYDFLGWYRNTTASTPNTFPGTTYNWQYGTNRLYAVWGYVKFTSNGHCTMAVTPSTAGDPSRMVGVPYYSTVSINNATGELTITGPSGASFSGRCVITPDTGYEFSSWSRSVGNLTAVISQAVTFTANIDVKKYVVSFLADTGGQVSQSQISDVPHGSTLTINGNVLIVKNIPVTATPSTNYQFNAWTDSNYNVLTTGTPIVGNVTIYARFDRILYTVTVATTTHTEASHSSVPNLSGNTQIEVANDGSYIDIGSTRVSVGFDAGWMLDYWSYTDPATSQTRQLHAGDSTSINAATTFTVYAKVITYTHTINYNSNGGSGAMADTVVTDTNSGRTNVQLAECTFTYSDKVFVNWTVRDAGFDDKGTFNPGDTVQVPANTTYYAIANWADDASFLIFFDPNGEGATTPEASRRVHNGDYYGTLPVPTWTGHTFYGWYSDNLGYYISAETIVDLYQNEIFAAQWDVEGIPFTITAQQGGAVTDGTTTGSSLSEEVHIDDVFHVSNAGVVTVGPLTITPLAMQGYEFAYWDPNDMDGRRVLNTDTSFSMTAHFVTSTGAKTIIVRSEDADEGQIDDGTTVSTIFSGTIHVGDVFNVSGATISVGSYELTATPATGYSFDMWEGVVNGHVVSYSDSGFVIIAHFINADDTRVPEVLPHGSLGDREGNCYISMYTDAYSSEPTAVLSLPNIQSIEKSDNAQLTEISTIIYGFDKNFVMDTGTVEKLTVTFTRVQPDYTIVDDDFNHQDMWSNGYWFKMLKFFFQRWQNLNYGEFNDGVVRTGGYRFHFEPGTEPKRGNSVNYTDLYPVIDRYAFVLGGIEMRMSGNNLQYMTVTLPLTVGSMVRLIQNVSEAHEVRYVSNIAGLPEFTMNYPSHTMFPAANVPYDWPNGAYVGLKRFEHWSSNTSVAPAGSSTPTSTWYPGMVLNDINNEIRTMVASWSLPVKHDSFTYDDESEGRTVWGSADIQELVSGNVRYMRLWIVSGGGGGGGGQYSNLGVWASGGGGGSGGYYTGTFGLDLAGLQSIIFQVGEGGTGELGQTNGGSGGDSYVTLKYDTREIQLKLVPGGAGGISSPSNGKGGAGSPIGGASGNDATAIHGGNGGVPPDFPITLGFSYTIWARAGLGGNGTDGTSGDGYGAGGGGAAPTSSGGTVIKRGGDGSPGYIIVAFYE